MVLSTFPAATIVPKAKGNAQSMPCKGRKKISVSTNNVAQKFLNK